MVAGHSYLEWYGGDRDFEEVCIFFRRVPPINGDLQV